MLTAEATLLQARQQMAALVAAAPRSQRVTLLLSVGGGFDPVRRLCRHRPRQAMTR